MNHEDNPSHLYVCEFAIRRGGLWHKQVSGPNMACFKNGFWITNEYKYVGTGDPDRYFWIPPHAINCIRREKFGG